MSSSSSANVGQGLVKKYDAKEVEYHVLIKFFQGILWEDPEDAASAQAKEVGKSASLLAKLKIDDQQQQQQQQAEPELPIGEGEPILTQKIKVMILRKLSLEELGILRLVNHNLNNLVVQEVMPGMESIGIQLNERRSIWLPKNCYQFTNQKMALQVLLERHPGVKKLKLSATGLAATDKERILSPKFFTGPLSLTRLAVDGMEIRAGLLKSLGCNQPKLESLELDGCEYYGEGLAKLGTKLKELSTLKMPSHVGAKPLAQAVRAFHRRGQQLTTVKVKGECNDDFVLPHDDESMLVFLLQNFPTLEHIQLHFVEIRDAKLTKMVAANLRVLDLSFVQGKQDWNRVLYPVLVATPMPHLTKLCLKNEKNPISAELFNRLVANSPKLVQIELACSGGFHAYYDSIVRLPYLKHLLVWSISIAKEHVLGMLRRTPHLWELEMNLPWAYLGKQKLFADHQRRELEKDLLVLLKRQRRTRILSLTLPIDSDLLAVSLVHVNVMLNQYMGCRPPGYLVKPGESLYRFIYG